MLRRPPRSTRTATLVPYTPLVRSVHARGKVVEDAVVAQPRRIDRQPRSRLVAPMQLLDRQQPRGEESFSVLMIMAEMHAGGPGQVLMAITQHRKLPVEPGGNPPAPLVEPEITRPAIAVTQRDMTNGKAQCRESVFKYV